MSNRKRKTRRTHFSSHSPAKDNTLRLADDALSDAVPTEIIPLSTLPNDEDAIDRLLIDASFDVDDHHYPELTPLQPNEITRETVPLPDTVDDDDLITPIKPTRKVSLAKSKSDSQVNEFIKSYFSKRSALLNAERQTTIANTDIDAEQSDSADTATIVEDNVNDNLSEPPVGEQTDRISELLFALEQKTQKNRVLGYSALLLGTIALIACMILGFGTIDASTKIKKLSELIDIIEEDVANLNEKSTNITQYPHALAPKIIPIMSVLPSETHTAILSSTIAATDTNVVNKTISNTTDNTELPILESPTIQHSHKIRHKNHAKKSITTDNNSMETIEKTLSRSTQNKNRNAELKQQRQRLIKLRDTDKIKSLELSTTKVKSNLKNAATETWMVNIAASKQQDYIKSQANSLAKRGIPVKIIPVLINHGTWYRLRVGGFKDKDSANAYANKLKRSFGLNSVWVGNQ